MHREGHIGTALLAYAPIGAVTLSAGFEQLAILGGVGAAALAMLPDVDQRIPGIRHRGPTHTVWFAGAAGGLASVTGALTASNHGILPALGFALWAGVTTALVLGSHLVADALTPAGIRPLAPIRDEFYSYEVARASNPIANYVLLAMGVAATGVALWVGSTVSAL